MYEINITAVTKKKITTITKKIYRNLLHDLKMIILNFIKL